jgi:predicted solute-binding protein
VQLARVILKRKFGAEPAMAPHPPQLKAMLEHADAALVIGDPALRLDPATLPYRVYDLGAEWTELTGLPMVFAVWAGQEAATGPAVAGAFLDSCRYGREHLEEIVREEAPRRGLAQDLAREYLNRHIVHELGEREYRGLRRFLELAAGEGAAALRF